MTGTMIGLGCEKDGLYLLDSSILVALSAIRRDVPSRSDELLAWHCRLGYLSFSVLRKMFPHLSISNFNFYVNLANWLNIVDRLIQSVIKIKVLSHFNSCILMYGVLLLLLLSLVLGFL